MNLTSEEGVGGGVEELGIVGGDGGENKKSRNRDLRRRVGVGMGKGRGFGTIDYLPIV